MIDISGLSNDELTARLADLVKDENRCLAAVLAHIAEFDKRDISRQMGHPSCFVYCTKVLCYSEDAAYKRITVARSARNFPSILTRMETGRLSLTAALMLGPHLTSENHRRLLDSACGKTKFKIERLIVSMAPQPDGQDHIQRMPQTGNPAGDSSLPQVPTNSSAASAQDAAQPLHLRQSIHPTAPERVRFAFTGSDHLLSLLRRAQDVLRHKYPAGDLEKIFLEALEALLDYKDPERKLLAKVERAAAGRARDPRPQSAWAFAQRHIPQAVKDAVWRRDRGQCVYRGGDGERCPERGGLEFDHIVPFALGGPSNNPRNIRLLCKAHNLQMARQAFGESALRRQAGDGQISS